MRSELQSIVRRRRVFYIPGFDPMPPRRYRELYRKEGPAQAAISGYEIDLTGRTDGPGFGWLVHGRMDGHEVQTTVDVLVWSDIVQDSMKVSIPATYAQMLRTAWTYCATGSLWRLMRLRKGPVIAALYPVATLVVQLLLAIGIGWGAVMAISAAPWPVPSALLVMIACVVVGLVLMWFKARDGRVFAYYLMHDYAFAASCAGANPKMLETRMADFAKVITKAAEDSVDEVLVVGHSSGASLAISILADIHRAGDWPDTGPELSLLTLGHVVPMTSFLPKAGRLRADLRYLSAQRDIAWVDVTAPGDGCAFALCDPVAVSGVAPADKRWPLVISAAFSNTLSPAKWKALRRRFFRLHFQYLCAFDVPGDYDYFRITAGPMTLRQRFAGRAPSPSRLETPVNAYVSVAE